MTMNANLTALLLVPFLAISIGWSDERAEALAANTALKTLFDAVDSLDSDAAKQAEEAHTTLERAGKRDARAAYALALVRTRSGEYERAAELLDSLPNADKRLPAILRLRLWLALELDEPAKA